MLQKFKKKARKIFYRKNNRKNNFNQKRFIKRIEIRNFNQMLRNFIEF